MSPLLQNPPVPPANPITHISREWLVTMRASLQAVLGGDKWERFIENLKPSTQAMIRDEEHPEAWINTDTLLDLLSHLNEYFGANPTRLRGTLIGEEIAEAALWIQGDKADLSTTYITLVGRVTGFVKGDIQIWSEDGEDGSATLLLYCTMPVPGFFTDYSPALVEAYLDKAAEGSFTVEHLQDFQGIKDLHAYLARPVG